MPVLEDDFCIKLLPTLLEVLELFYFAEHFLTAKVSRAKRYLANVCFYLLDCGAIYCFQEAPPVKYAMVTLLIVLWARYVYQTSVINGVFLLCFQFSYWYSMDLFFVSIASFLGGDASTQPEHFAVLYTLIKAAELLIVVAVCRGCCRHRDASWQSNLRILAFPVCVLCVSVYLLSIVLEEPRYAAKLLGCIMLLLAVDILSIYLLEYLEERQYDAAFHTALKQNLQMINANIDSWKEAYMEQRRYTHDFQNKLLVLRGLAGKEGTPAELQAYLNELLHDTKIPVRERRKIVFQAKAANAVGYICMENTTQEPVRISNNRIAATSKSNSVLHGFGLRNVLYVLDKNQAVYQISYSEETHSFQFVAQIASVR